MKNARVYLRSFEPEDYRLTYEWRNNPKITKLLSGNTYFISKEREKNWVIDKSTNDRTDIYFAICLKENNEMIGFCSINNIDLRNRKVEWGGSIIGVEKYWGKGYAKESSYLMINYIFNEYPIHKCYAYCLEKHKVTEKLFYSLGFKKDGMLRDEIFKEGEFKSLLVFSITEKEFFSIEQ